VPSLPSEAFPPSEAAVPAPRHLFRDADVQRPPVTSPACRHAVHRDPCPLALSFPLPHLSLRLPVRASQVWFRRASRLSSANGSVAKPAVARRPRPVLPWACSNPPPALPRTARLSKDPRERQRPQLPAP
jgi:hypothetical protein